MGRVGHCPTETELVQLINKQTDRARASRVVDNNTQCNCGADLAQTNFFNKIGRPDLGSPWGHSADCALNKR